MTLKKIDAFPNTSKQISDSASIMSDGIMKVLSVLGSYIYSDIFQNCTPTQKQSL